MANPAPTINQINAFNATQGTIIDFNIIGGTELVRSNKIYIYDLSDNSLICTHLYTSTESIHELPPNTDGSIVYESGKSSADFVNGKQYYAQIQTFTNIAGTQGGSGLSVSKLFWCLVDPSLTISTIPSSISTTSYNVSATYNANTSVVSNIIQQYQFNLYSATGSLLQSSGVVVGNGEQQGTSTIYDLSYNFSGLEVGSSYYVVVEVTTTQGMSLSAQSGTFTVSIDTPTLGEATVVNNACDGYISVTSNLSSEYGGSASGEIATFETDSVNNVTKLEVALTPTQLGSGTPSPSNVRPIVGHSEVAAKIVGKNLFETTAESKTESGITWTVNDDGSVTVTGTATGFTSIALGRAYVKGINTSVKISNIDYAKNVIWESIRLLDENDSTVATITSGSPNPTFTVNLSEYPTACYITIGLKRNNNVATNTVVKIQVEIGEQATDWVPYVEPVEVEQDFNVTLTPTVTDETPYQFKATGDVRGDRESLELVGGTVNWNQLLYSKFEQNWAAPLGTMSVQDGIATVTADGSGNCYMRTQTSIHPANHVYLMSCDVKLDSNNATDYPTTTFLLSWTSGGYVNKSNPAKGTWGNVATLLKPNVDWSVVGIYCMGTGQQTSGEKAQAKKPLCIDLTAFFGNSAIADSIYAMEQSTAGAGVAFMRKYFPKLFTAEYNTGTLKSVKPTAHVTRGVNQCDETPTIKWFIDSNGNVYKNSGTDTAAIENKIPCLPNTEYCISTPNNSRSVNRSYLCEYDANENYIGLQYVDFSTTKKSLYTTSPNTRYFLVKFYSTGGYSASDFSNFCINLSDPDINGQYFPADHHTYPISELELRGLPKLVDGELRFDGDTRKADGTVTRKYGIVDLGTLNWEKNSGNNYFYAYQSPPARPNSASLNSAGIPSVQTVTGDKIYVGYNGITYAFYSSASTKEEFKTAMSGVYLVYELATPTTETADPYTNPQIVDPYGTEEFVSSNGVPVGNKTTYKTRDIFGGKIDLVSGVLTVDRKMITVDGNSNVGLNDTSTVASRFTLEVLDSLSVGNDDTMIRTVSDRFKSIAGVGVLDRDLWCTALISNHRIEFNIPNDIADTRSEAIAWFGNNPTKVLYPLATPLIYQLTPHQIETLIGTNNVWSDAGDVLIEFNIPITDLLVKRQDVDDVSGNWLTLYSQPVSQASDMDFTFIDFLNQYGKTYKYALVPLLTQTQSGIEVEVEGGYTVSDEVQSIFDGVYIGDGTGVQRLKAGVAYNNLNTNQQVGVIPTLGNKYPIVVSNSNIQYDTGSVSGLIVPDDFYSNGNLSRLDMSDKREVINDFLTNKKPKILKDWNGNIWLVVFTDNIDVSFDNNYGMGIATFSSGWTEVGDPTNQEDLQQTGLIDVGGD